MSCRSGNDTTRPPVCERPCVGANRSCDGNPDPRVHKQIKRPSCLGWSGSSEVWGVRLQPGCATMANFLPQWGRSVLIYCKCSRQACRCPGACWLLFCNVFLQFQVFGGCWCSHNHLMMAAEVEPLYLGMINIIKNNYNFPAHTQALSSCSLPWQVMHSLSHTHTHSTDALWSSFI